MKPTPTLAFPLAVPVARIRKAANSMTQEIRPDVRKNGEYARNQTNEAIREFSEWELAVSLGNVQEEWEKKLNRLKDRISTERQSMVSSVDMVDEDEQRLRAHMKMRADSPISRL